MSRRILIPLLIAVLFAGEAGAQIRSLGGYYSFKGFGASALYEREGSEDLLSMTVLMDLTSILYREEMIRVPGSQFRFSYDYLLKDWIIDATGTRVQLFAGPGLMLGYIRDVDKKHGLTIAATGETGLLFNFVKDCIISLTFPVDLGIHYGKRSTYENINRYDPTIDPYKNGFLRIPYPELRIMRRF